MTTKRLFTLFIASETLLLLLALLGGYPLFINAQIGFITAFLVIVGSFYSYKRMVDKQVALHSNEKLKSSDPDAVDKIDDPFDLYSDDISKDTSAESMSAEEIKATILAEKRRLKQQKRSARNFIKGVPGALSVMRLGAYAVLVMGFFYLLRSESLQLTAYLGGITGGIGMALLFGNKRHIDAN